MAKHTLTGVGFLIGLLPLTTAGAPITLSHISERTGETGGLWTTETVALPPSQSPPLPVLPPPPAPPLTYHVWVTAYSSTPEETDDTPFFTASGSRVREGVIAANFLPFGTKVTIPELFGDRVFTVEDRMHRRKNEFVDIWMPNKWDAEEFGIKRATLVVVVVEDASENVKGGMTRQ